MPDSLNNPQVQIDTPSVTPQMVWLAVGALEKLFQNELERIDKSITLAHDDLVRVPTDVQKQVGNLKELHQEKFKSIQTQFDERDTRTTQEKEAQTKAVDAAFQAQKEAAAKSEERFTKQIDQLEQLFRTEINGANTRMDELKDRFNRGEGRGEGVDKNRTDNRLFIGVLIAAAGLFITAIGALVGAVIWIISKGT